MFFSLYWSSCGLSDLLYSLLNILHITFEFFLLPSYYLQTQNMQRANASTGRVDRNWTESGGKAP